MVRLINDIECEGKVCEGCNKEFPNEPCNPLDCYIRHAIAECKTVDAVEVVRCKACTHWKRHTKVDELYGACSLIGCTKHENGFCDCGERRKDDGE